MSEPKLGEPKGDEGRFNPTPLDFAIAEIIDAVRYLSDGLPEEARERLKRAKRRLWQSIKLHS